MIGKRGIEQDIQIAWDEANRHLGASRYLEAEVAFERMVERVRELLVLEPTAENWTTLAYTLGNLAGVIKETGGRSEQEGLLTEAFAVIRYRTSGHDGYAAKLLISLAEVYRLGEFPLIQGLSGDPTKAQLREHRRTRFAAGAASDPIIYLSSEGWSSNLIPCLVEAITILRELGQSEQQYLAFALNLLGEAYLEGGQTAEALEPLLEAENHYELLCAIGSGNYQNMLMDTRNLIARALT